MSLLAIYMTLSVFCGHIFIHHNNWKGLLVKSGQYTRSYIKTVITTTSQFCFCKIDSFQRLMWLRLLPKSQRKLWRKTKSLSNRKRSLKNWGKMRRDWERQFWTEWKSKCISTVRKGEVLQDCTSGKRSCIIRKKCRCIYYLYFISIISHYICLWKM